MRAVIVATILWSALSFQAAAADAKLTHLAHLMAEAAVGENAPFLTTDFTAGTTLGKDALRFETTTLAGIQLLDGGAGHAISEATGEVTWVCYTRQAKPKEPAETVWFISNASGPPVSLNMVVVQRMDAAKDDGCATVTKDFAFPTFGIPAVGSTTQVLKAHFGTLPYDKVHNVYYDSTRPAPDGGGKTIYQRLGYVLKRGVVVGIALSQTTD